jgi:hypothetical protein
MSALLIVRKVSANSLRHGQDVNAGPKAGQRAGVKVCV